MTLQELSFETFTKWQKSFPLSNLYQTINYAMLMAEVGYDYDIIGLVDEDNNILAASIILFKKINNKYTYGYAPRGFLIDYTNEYLFNKFTVLIKEYYQKKGFIFIKINPNIAIGEISLTDKSVIYNSSIQTQDILKNNGYKKLANNIYFESQLPRFNSYIDLQYFDGAKMAKNTKNKIRKGIRKGLVFEKVGKNKIQDFYNLIKNKNNQDEFFYQDLYTVFEKDNNIDLFLVSIDYNAFLQNSQYCYNQELEKNNYLNKRLINNTNNKTLNSKMNSDKVLLVYKNDIMEATKGISENKNCYIAGAMVIKHNNTVNILYSSYDKNFKRFAPNYFLHYNIIKYYQDTYDYLDLFGMVGNFNNDNPYHGLNRFKEGFNPKIYEFIGEYDLIINEKEYENLLYKGLLAKEFDKK